METNIEGGYTEIGVEVYGQSSQGVHCKKNLKPFVYFVDNFFGDILNFFFYVQEQYSIDIRAQHGEGIVTHLEHNLELLLKAKAIDKLNKNQVYGISMTIV